MNRDTRDYYDLLGVPRDADRSAIKQAFRTRAREVHPDVSSDPGAKEAFAELAKAYRVLSTPVSRALYDRYGYLGAGNGGFDAARPGPVSGRNAASTASTVAQIDVEFVEAIRGATRKVQVTSVATCSACGGRGAKPGSAVDPCSACGGDGRVRRASQLGAGRLLQIEKCPDCGGSGRVIRDPCVECGGTGESKADRTVKVRIPPGAEDGGVIRVNGGGRSEPGEGRDEAVFVRLRVLPPRDSRLVRYTAAVALVVALVLFVVLLASPQALIAGA